SPRSPSPDRCGASTRSRKATSSCGARPPRQRSRSSPTESNTSNQQPSDEEMHVKNLFDMTGKVAIVTGSGRGLGKAIALGLAEDVADEAWDQVISINLKGYFNCSQFAGRQMLQQGTGGSIVNNSSIAGAVGIKGLTAYAAAKGGVNQMTRTMAVEWASRGVR